MGGVDLGANPRLALRHDRIAESNHMDTLAPLAKAGVPILAVVGDADKTVPASENIDIVEKRYQALGGKIQVMRKPGCDHHPHSLPDPAPIVDFVDGCYR